MREQVAQEKMYGVYVIQNAAHKFYIGVSEDVRHRVQQHNEGISKWTKGKGPWALVWTSAAMSLSEARKLENKLKRQGRGSGFYALTGLPLMLKPGWYAPPTDAPNPRITIATERARATESRLRTLGVTISDPVQTFDEFDIGSFLDSEGNKLWFCSPSED